MLLFCQWFNESWILWVTSEIPGGQGSPRQFLLFCSLICEAKERSVWDSWFRRNCRKRRVGKSLSMRPCAFGLNTIQFPGFVSSWQADPWRYLQLLQSWTVSVRVRSSGKSSLWVCSCSSSTGRCVLSPNLSSASNRVLILPNFPNFYLAPSLAFCSARCRLGVGCFSSLRKSG